jgi:hypothetical protein
MHPPLLCDAIERFTRGNSWIQDERCRIQRAIHANVIAGTQHQLFPLFEWRPISLPHDQARFGINLLRIDIPVWKEDTKFALTSRDVVELKFTD